MLRTVHPRKKEQKNLYGNCKGKVIALLSRNTFKVEFTDKKGVVQVNNFLGGGLKLVQAQVLVSHVIWVDIGGPL